MSDSSFPYIVKSPEFLIDRLKAVFAVIPEDLHVFRISLYVKQFYPEDIAVNVIGRKLIICGNHREHVDTHGFVTREFKREYDLSEDYDPKSVSSILTLDGILKVFAYHKKLWKEFMSEEGRRFQAYISIGSSRIKELSWNVEDHKMSLKVKLKRSKYEEEEEINQQYYLPADVNTSTLDIHFVPGQMLELAGEYKPETTEIVQQPGQRDSKDSPENR